MSGIAGIIAECVRPTKIAGSSRSFWAVSRLAGSNNQFGPGDIRKPGSHMSLRDVLLI